MTMFSRCDVPLGLLPPSRRARVPAAAGKLRLALSGFAEDLGILFRYAVGLDYQGRGRVDAPR